MPALGQDVHTPVGGIHPTRRCANAAFKPCGHGVYDRQADVCTVLVQVLETDVHSGFQQSQNTTIYFVRTSNSLIQVSMILYLPLFS